MKENLNSTEYNTLSYNSHSNNAGSFAPTSTLTLKEQTNKDIDKLFGIKFDDPITTSGASKAGGPPNGVGLHLSPQIKKPKDINSMAKAREHYMSMMSSSGTGNAYRNNPHHQLPGEHHSQSR